MTKMQKKKKRSVKFKIKIIFKLWKVKYNNRTLKDLRKFKGWISMTIIISIRISVYKNKTSFY